MFEFLKASQNNSSEKVNQLVKRKAQRFLLYSGTACFVFVVFKRFLMCLHLVMWVSQANFLYGNFVEGCFLCG